MDFADILKDVESSLVRVRRVQLLDGLLYNGGTVVALFCAGLATVISATSLLDPLKPWPPLLTALATFVIGVDRALQFGPRWRFNRALAAAHISLSRRIKALHLVDGEELKAEQATIFQTYISLTKDEYDFPGSGDLASPSKSPTPPPQKSPSPESPPSK